MPQARSLSLCVAAAVNKKHEFIQWQTSISKLTDWFINMKSHYDYYKKKRVRSNCKFVCCHMRKWVAPVRPVGRKSLELDHCVDTLNIWLSMLHALHWRITQTWGRFKATPMSWSVSALIIHLLKDGSSYRRSFQTIPCPRIWAWIWWEVSSNDHWNQSQSYLISTWTQWPT